MKKYTLLPVILLSLFLLNCGQGGPFSKPSSAKTAITSEERTLIDNIKNSELKETMSHLAQGIQLEDPDYLLLALDEETGEETQIKILDFLITHTKGKTAQQDAHPVVFKAIEKKKNEVVKFLLTRVSIDYKATVSGLTFVHAAVATASKDTVQAFLLKNGDLINTNNSMHGTPLHYLLDVPFELNGKATNDIKTRKEILELLLQNGKINLKLKNRRNHTAAQLADILAKENEAAAANTADTKLKQSHLERKDFYKWAADKITTKLSHK